MSDETLTDAADVSGLPIASLAPGNAPGDTIKYNGTTWLASQHNTMELLKLTDYSGVIPSVPVTITEGRLYKKPGDDALYWSTNGGGEIDISAGSGSTISGPGASTNNAITRWSGATGTSVKDSLITIDNSGVFNYINSGSYLNSVTGLYQGGLLIFIQDASRNLRAGLSAVTAITVGTDNTGIGHQALKATTSGLSNSALGSSALLANLTGSYNTAMGHGSVASNTASNSNTGIGYNALNAVTGENNTAVGSSAGSLITSGKDNTLIGAGAAAGSGSANNRVVIGSAATGAADNSVTFASTLTELYMAGLGNTSTTSILYYNTVNGKISQGATSALTDLNASNIASGTLAVERGGTGQTTYTNGQLLIGNTTGNTLTKATLTGTTDQIIVTNGTGSITLSTPQDINTTSTPTFGDTTGNQTLLFGSTTDATTDIKKITVRSQGFAVLDITGDTANTGGEPGGAQLYLSVDAGFVYGKIGLTQTAGGDGSSGGTTTNSTANSLLIASANDLQLAPGNTVSATFSTTALTTTLPIIAPLGSVTNPSYTFTADTNTGLYSPGADTLGLVTGGTNRLSIANAAITSTIPIQLPSGSNPSPALVFSSDPDTGIYNPSANTMAFVLGGTDRLSISTTALTSSLPIIIPVGAVGAPGLTFNSDTDTGIYSSAADNLDIATLGTQRANINGTALTTTVPHRVPIGNAAAPSYTFATDTNTGLYSSGADTLDFATNGLNRLSLSTAALTSTLPILMPLGSVGAPSYSFTTDTNTGIYSSGVDTLDITTGGTNRLSVSTAAITTTLPNRTAVGTAAAPAYSFASDTNTGMYQNGADIIGFATNGTLRLSVSNSAVTSTVALSAPSLTLSTTPLAATSGGTGLDVFAVGDILFANTTTTLSRLADVATGNALISGGVNVAPAWGKIGLTTHVSGTLAVGSGGTGQTTYTNGQLLIGNTTGNTLTKATLTGTTNQITVTNGTGSITLSTPQDINTTSAPTFGNASGNLDFTFGSTSDLTTHTKKIITRTNGFAGLDLRGDFGDVSTAGVLIRMTLGNITRLGRIGLVQSAGTDGSSGGTLTGTTSGSIYICGDDDLQFGASAAIISTLSASSWRSTVPYQAGNGTAASPTYSFSSDTDTGIYRVGTNNLGISTGGTVRADIDNGDFNIFNTLKLSNPHQINGNPTNVMLAPLFMLINSTTSLQLAQLVVNDYTNNDCYRFTVPRNCQITHAIVARDDDASADVTFTVQIEKFTGGVSVLTRSGTTGTLASGDAGSLTFSSSGMSLSSSDLVEVSASVSSGSGQEIVIALWGYASA